MHRSKSIQQRSHNQLVQSKHIYPSSSLVNRQTWTDNPKNAVTTSVPWTKGLSQQFHRERAFLSNSYPHCQAEFLPQGCANGHCKPFQSSFQDSQAQRKSFRIVFQIVKDYWGYSMLRIKQVFQEVLLKESKKHSIMYSNQAIKSLVQWLLFRKLSKK